MVTFHRVETRAIINKAERSVVIIAVTFDSDEKFAIWALMRHPIRTVQ
jgi:hypothetical protein